MTDKALIAVVAVALTLRLLFFGFIDPVGWDENAFYRHSFYDAGEYHNLTKTFVIQLEGGLLKPFMSYSLYHKTPAYPAYVTLFYATIGHTPWPVFLSQIILDSATTALVYLIAKRMTAAKHAPAIAALLYATDVGAVYYASTLMAETIFIFLVAASMHIMLAAEESGWRWTRIAAAGLALGAATMMRHMGVLLPVVFLACMLFSRGFRSLGAKRMLVAAAVLIAAYALILAPWQYRNYLFYGHYSLVTIGGYNLCHQNAGDVWYALEKSPMPESFCEVKGLTNPFEMAERNWETGMDYILKHPLTYLRLHIEGVYSLFTDRPEKASARIWQLYGDIFAGHGVGEGTFKAVLGGYLSVLSALGIASLTAGAARLIGGGGSAFGRAAAASLMIYFANMTGVYNSSPLGEKYILPILPFMSAICAAGFAWALSRMRGRKSNAGDATRFQPPNA